MAVQFNKLKFLEEIELEEYQKRPEIQLLNNPNLWDLFNKEFDQRIVGEEQARMTLFLICCGKYVQNKSHTSYNLFISDESGVGKDFLGKNVLAIFPDVHARSRISAKALTYWHNHKFEPDWSWDGKILYLMDIEESVLNSSVFKVFLSDETKSTIVINNRAIDIEIKGKPIVVVTSAESNPNSENLRRIPCINLDSSREQTRRIMRHQAKIANLGEKLAYDPKFTEALKKLQYVKVRIPEAMTDKITDAYPAKHVIMRTHFQRLLDYMKASAALHQYQRKTDEVGFILAESQDYDIAAIAIQATTSNPLMIPLTKNMKKLIDDCRELGTFSIAEIAAKVTYVQERQLRRNLKKLQELGFVISFIDDSDDNPRKHKLMYQFTEFHLTKIPNWSQLNSNDDTNDIYDNYDNNDNQDNQDNNDNLTKLEVKEEVI